MKTTRRDGSMRGCSTGALGRMWWVAVGALLLGAGCSSDDSGSGSGPGSGSNIPGTGGPGFGLIDSARIQSQPEALQFNATLASTGEITLTNVSGQTTIELREVRLKEDTTPHFAIESVTRTTLGPLESALVTVSYAPGADGSNPTGTLVVQHSLEPDQGPIQVPLFVSAQGGALEVLPTELLFGPLPVGGQQIRTTTTTSAGTAAFQLVSAELTPQSHEAFSVGALSLPATIGIDGSLPVEVLYEPTEVGGHQGELHLRYEGAQTDLVVVTLHGTAIASNLVSDPGLIDFGMVDVGGESLRTLGLRNSGQAPIDVTGVLPTFGTHEGIEIVSAPSWPVTLEGSDAVELALRFSPDAPFPYSNSPIGGLSVSTGEEGGAQFVVPMFGNVSAPRLVVSPMFVDFGLVAMNDTITRDVLLVNQGSSPLDLEAVTLTDDSGGEFVMMGFAPANLGPGAALLPDQSVVLTLAFTNTTAGAIATGNLSITSSDPEHPVVNVPLEAKRGGAKSCSVVLEPAALNFGIVPHGNSKTMPIKVRNIGTGPCTFQSATTFDCGSGIFGFLGQCQAGIGNFSQHFKVIGQPPPIPGGIPQGGAVTLNVNFKPPADAPLIDFFNSYNGAIQVKVTDPSNGDASIAVPAGATPQDLSPNLLAQSGIADIGVIPWEVNFGLITLGCQSPDVKITIFNNGNAPLVVDGIALQDCTPEFAISQMPPIPPGGLEVNQGSPAEVWVRYTPQLPSKSFCTLAVTSSDNSTPLITVPLEGTGTFDTERTDTFVQASGKEVDVLFVIDDSGSMSDVQNNLANNMQSFINQAEIWNTDFQLGVVTTDMDADSKSGRLQGNPRIVTPGPQAPSQFAANTKVGTNGSPIERGLEAAYRALSLPLIRQTNTSCTSDGDCSAPDQCVAGLCGGHNAGFLRADAALEIVMVSDEEDQSPSPLSFYVDYFKSIKGFANQNMMHVHSIVGDPSSGCSTPQGSADPGKRYVEVTNQTGGLFGSICSPSFANVLADIGNVAFGIKTQFFLSAQAQPGTVAVAVNGAACPAGWTHDVPSNSVIFDESGPCMPAEDDVIVVDYKILCIPAGN